jgi:hypothetical protein
VARLENLPGGRYTITARLAERRDAVESGADERCT